MYLNVAETAAYLELPEWYIREKIADGQIRAVHNGEEYFMNRDQFTHTLDELKRLREFEDIEKFEPVPESYDYKDED
ncbi:DNA-binding protein [Brevibacillus daliensis]|uniref:DNA-binding protein n=1 Tax=Brevibacillus daliensis TaxID=2892995 RepID=UPI001E46C05C|nr:DNA-binding protein [Brevibacillus daliensis]